MPANELLKFIKGDAGFAQLIFQGFTPRARSLSQPIVRQRLLRELSKLPPLANALLDCWLEIFSPLITILEAEDFSPNEKELRSLARSYGDAALRYGLLHASRETVRALADHLPSQTAKAPGRASPPAPAGTPVQPQRSPLPPRDDLRERTARLAQELDRLQGENVRQSKLLAEREEELTALQKQAGDYERRLEREQRRVKKAEEETERLRKELKERARQQQTETARAGEPDFPLTTKVVAAIEEAIIVLRRGLASAQQIPEEMTEIASPPTPPPSPAKVAATKRQVGSITLPTSRGKQAFSLAQVLVGLRKNDQELLNRIRDGIAHLANEPARERTIVAEITRAGIPDTLLRGPLRPAIIDGSNVASLNMERGRARLAYIQQVQLSAWREGYFPVIIIVDASLRHSIDRADLLMDMVDSGEIIMAPAGTSADELLIDEAEHRHAVLITNDRMLDWPPPKRWKNAISS